MSYEKLREAIEEYDATMENMISCFSSEVDAYVKEGLERCRAMVPPDSVDRIEASSWKALCDANQVLVQVSQERCDRLLRLLELENGQFELVGHVKTYRDADGDLHHTVRYLDDVPEVGTELYIKVKV